MISIFYREPTFVPQKSLLAQILNELYNLVTGND